MKSICGSGESRIDPGEGTTKLIADLAPRTGNEHE
jgi:hypothetical protein